MRARGARELLSAQPQDLVRSLGGEGDPWRDIRRRCLAS